MVHSFGVIYITTLSVSRRRSVAKQTTQERLKLYRKFLTLTSYFQNIFTT